MAQIVLNPVQISLLRLFNRPMSEKETEELRGVIFKHYSNLLDDELNKVITEKGYTQKDFDEMLNADS